MKTTRFVPAFTATLAALSLITGCLSPEEREARRQWAFDLSGLYDEVRPEGTEAGTLEVVNETSKNNVKLIFTRGALYDGEEAYIDRVADEAVREALKAEVVIGEGESELRDSLIGAENISTDFGQSSEVYTRNDEYACTPGVEDASDCKLFYAVQLHIENGSDELKGKLVIHLSEERPAPTAEDPDRRERHVEKKEIDVTFLRHEGPIDEPVCTECLEGPSDEADPAEEDPSKGGETTGDDGSSGEG